MKSDNKLSEGMVKNNMTTQTLKNWKTVKALDILDGLVTGKKDVNQAHEQGLYPFFSCAREDKMFSDEYQIDDNAIIIAGNGSYTGYVKKYSGKMDLYQRTYALYNFKKNIDWKFIYYVFKSQFEARFMGGTHGAAIPYITKPTIIEFEFEIPESYQQQKNISDILSTYDDLIENNTRRIQILEQMAQAIYTEWFVNFRFPSHEKEKIIDSKTHLGKIPEGWEIKNLYDIANIKMGYAFKSNQFNEEQKGKKTVRIRDISAATAITYTTEAVDSSYIVKRGDFLIGMDGIFHMNHWQDSDALLVQRVCRVRPKNEKMWAYISLCLTKPIKEFEATLMGSTVAHLGSRHLEEIFIAVPGDSFNETLEYLNLLLKTKLQYSQVNQNLRKMRDLLVPKLITGEIRV